MLNKNTLLKYLLIILFLSSVSLSANNNSINLENPIKDDLHLIKEKSYSIQPGKEINVDASFGDVLITTWDKSEVYIKILGNEKAEKKIDFVFDNNENLITVKAKSQGNNFNWFSSGPQLRFEIKVPSSFNNTIHTSGGDIKVSDVKGNNNLNTSGGDITLKNIFGNLKVSTSGGDITLYKIEGNMNVSTSGGDIISEDFMGNFDASTSGGNIRLKGKESSINAETSGGNISLKYFGSNKGINLNTSGGNISINLPSDFNASAYLSSSGGDVNCDFRGNNVVKISDSKFQADINSGGNKLVAKTSGGNVSVRKN